MAQDSKIKEFPDIGSKLTAPTKKSLFERQKAEAEAKRQREQEETAAVYEDFIKSFDDADDSAPSAGNAFRGAGSEGSGAGRAFGGPSKRHFTGPPTGPAPRGLGAGRGNSGPGSLGPPPPSLSRKRAYDGAPKDPNAGLFAFEDSTTGPVDAKSAFQASDDEDAGGRSRIQERVPPKPTLKLSSLPPGTSPAVIKSFLPSNLHIDAVRILPPSGPGTTERRSHAAIVTLAKETPAIDIDTAVSALQNRYLGRGYYLSLSRYLSSAALGVDLPTPGLSSVSASLPFGARPIPTGPAFNRGPPGSSHRGGFAPPQSYAPSGPGQFGRGAPSVQVNVIPPSDLKQLKLIHKILEALLTYGPEFEALLMSRKDIQKEARWAWLWDARSTGGVYYRWRLWDLLTGSQNRNGGGRGRTSSSTQTIFEGGAPWAPPEKPLPWEFTTHVEEFVSDSEYDSSDDEDSGDEGRRRHLHHHGGAPPPDTGNTDGDDQAYLNPLQKAKLVHLLARLPTSNAKLRRGDVARVTAFAIQHAGEGADEVVQMITSNVQKPFAFSGANPDYKIPVDDAALKDDEETEEDKKATEKEDTSSAQLIGLFIISDILSTSSTSGVRHAWRYRQLFEASLRQAEVFESLGRLEKVMHWGRMRADKWKRSVLSVLTLWEGWCVFPQGSQEHFTAVFGNPPLTAEEEAANMAAEKASVAALAAKSKWKTVDVKAHAESLQPESDRPGRSESEDNMDIDLDGEPMADDGDLDGEPMDDDDVDGDPMEDEQHDMADPGATSVAGNDMASGKNSETVAEAAGGVTMNKDGRNDHLIGARRRRPKAEDMFADSDGE
ncbi:hypothetical protein MMC07_009997 [Pseudocyphellaria aurata]|nr:hypothetical protein [Pseudocyphellaria aurata]